MATNIAYAVRNLPAIGVTLEQDFFTLTFAQVEELQTLAKFCGYKAPAGNQRNGSPVRYFWAFLQRVGNPKTELQHIVQGNYGQGWEDVTASLDYREARNDLKAYRKNCPEYAHRLIKRRVKRDTQ